MTQAPREVVAMVERGDVSETLARETLRTAGEDAGQVLEKAVTKARTAGRARATAKHVERPPRDRRTFADGVRFAVAEIRATWEPGEMPGGVVTMVERLEAEIAG